MNDKEDPWPECRGTTAISTTPRRKMAQMLQPNTDSEMPGPQGWHSPEINKINTVS